MVDMDVYMHDADFSLISMRKVIGQTDWDAPAKRGNSGSSGSVENYVAKPLYKIARPSLLDTCRSPDLIDFTIHFYKANVGRQLYGIALNLRHFSFKLGEGLGEAICRCQKAGDENKWFHADDVQAAPCPRVKIICG